MSYCLAMILHSEDTFYQHEDGLLADSNFDNFCRGFQVAFSRPGFHMAWEMHKPIFDARFANFVDKLISESPVSTSVDQLSLFKAGAAALKARAVTQ